MNATAPTLDALGIVSALPLEDGRLWGEAAYPWQLEDAKVILEDTGPRRHYLLRGRGMSKTSDVAGVVLGLLLTEAPPSSESFCYAVDADQAALLHDALAGFVRRAGLEGRLRLSPGKVENILTGATLVVESSDGASAYGKRPWLQVVDELGLWPDTPNHRALLAAILSAVPKVPGSRLIVITTAGNPTGIGARVWEQALDSKHWHTAKRPGPSPWWAPEDVEATRASLTASEWRRLIDCDWAAGADSLATVEDVQAAVRQGPVTLEPRPSVEYVAALDVGTRRDNTALAIGHREATDYGHQTVIDRLVVWRPEDNGGRVDLAEVEATVRAECKRYNNATLRFDRMQAEQLSQNLERQGVQTDEYVFSTAGANRLARSLWTALRDRTIQVPDDPLLVGELHTVQIVESAQGAIKLSNPAGHHDDAVTACSMVHVDLLDRGDIVGGVGISVPTGTIVRNWGKSSQRDDKRRRALLAIGGVRGRPTTPLMPSARTLLETRIPRGPYR